MLKTARYLEPPARYARRSYRPPVEVLFYPEQPTRMYYVIWKICGLEYGELDALRDRDDGIRRAAKGMALVFRDQVLPSVQRLRD